VGKEKRMNESMFICKFECGDFDAEYYEFIAERCDAWTKQKVERIIESGEMFDEFMDHMIGNWA